MINQIIALNGPHIHVVSHLLKMGGFYFNELLDKDDLIHYTKNNALVPFYSHIPHDSFELSKEYVNELFGFVKTINGNFTTNNPRDIVCIKYLLNTPFVGRIISIEYSFEELRNDIGDLVEQNYFEQNKQQIDNFLNECADSNWEIVKINYIQFIKNLEYRKNILQNISCNIDLIEHLWKNINKESKLTIFDALVEKYNKFYIKNYIIWNKIYNL
jgi:hypothetical protein